jgi:sialate O-acetylesterase
VTVRATRLAICGLAALFCAPIHAQVAPLALDPMIGDHAVLQRGHPLAIRGTAAPGEAIMVAFGPVSARGKADAQGRWQITLPPQATGAARSLSVAGRDGRRAVASDILIGDVWLCSGQSNMEWPVKAALNADAEIASSANMAIRMLTVPHTSHPAMQAGFAGPVAWTVAAPATVAGFSGACYFMARDLQKRLDVPMGLIQSSWGGSNIEAWTPAAALATLPGHQDAVALNALYARDRGAAEVMMAQMWQDWWHAKAGAATSPWHDDAGLTWQPVPTPLRDWKTWGVSALRNYNGMVWFDRTVDLTPAQAALGATLDLGAIDEIDQSWVNGRPVGNSFGWATERSYALTPGTLQAGRNRIVLNIYSAWGLGGMFGPADRIALHLNDGTRIPLGDGWRYAMAPAAMPSPPAAPWYAIGGQTGLYNAMIAPIGVTAIKGVAWYQGESNTGNAAEYATLLDTMKAGWRTQFGPATPFLIVQLPNFGAAATRPVTSGWASVREAQRRSTENDPRSALAVAIDLGDPSELHPPNKQGVGLRLARAARSLVYSEGISPSGPRVSSVIRATDGITVKFKDITGTLTVHSAANPIAFELCGDADSSCVFTDAKITGDRILLTNPNPRRATRIRYCWGDAPLCNLYDSEGLPAGPFELAIE